MTNSVYRQAEFLTSAAKLSQAPPDQGAEVAFAGRSNAGKSSALNAITDIRSLARISKTPGRTQLLNFFTLDDNRRLVDLPGYGFAKVPINVKRRWELSLTDYLQKRLTLRGLILLMDCRHPLTTLDQQMLIWCQEAQLNVHILLTKADKFKRGAAQNVLLEVSHILEKENFNASVQLFSATKRLGIDQVHLVLDQWLTLP